MSTPQKIASVVMGFAVIGFSIFYFSGTDLYPDLQSAALTDCSDTHIKKLKASIKNAQYWVEKRTSDISKTKDQNQKKQYTQEITTWRKNITIWKKKIDECRNNTWFVGNFSACVNNKKTRIVECRYADGSKSDPSLCESTKPAIEEKCTVDAGNISLPSWYTGAYEPCVNGVKTRTVECRNADGTKSDDSSKCRTAEPAKTQSCNPGDIYIHNESWFTGSYGACVNDVQKRTVECHTADGSVTDDSRCTTTKPTDMQSCTSSSVPTVTASWYTGAYEPCVTDTTKRTVECRTIDGKITDETSCVGTKPIAEGVCEIPLPDISKIQTGEAPKTEDNFASGGIYIDTIFSPTDAPYIINEMVFEVTSSAPKNPVIGAAAMMPGNNKSTGKIENNKVTISNIDIIVSKIAPKTFQTVFGLASNFTGHTISLRLVSFKYTKNALIKEQRVSLETPKFTLINPIPQIAVTGYSNSNEVIEGINGSIGGVYMSIGQSIIIKSFTINVSSSNIENLAMSDLKMKDEYGAIVDNSYCIFDPNKSIIKCNFANTCKTSNCTNLPASTTSGRRYYLFATVDGKIDGDAGELQIGLSANPLLWQDNVSAIYYPDNRLWKGDLGVVFIRHPDDIFKTKVLAQ